MLLLPLLPPAYITATAAEVNSILSDTMGILQQFLSASNMGGGGGSVRGSASLSASGALRNSTQRGSALSPAVMLPSDPFRS